ncbi:MAG: hypothetical protein IPM54_14240 [Polyangiaceae bacterium]|nr:hypothetical protein [Polyangiaceae bacterium]
MSKRPVVSEPHVVAQVAGGFVAADFAARAASKAADLARQDAAMAAAMREVERIRETIGSPEHIIGNPSTKHGEIAEYVEVGVRNARQILEGLTPTAMKDGLPRNGPVDYVIDGVDVQSKFINGEAKTLEHVLDHMRKYPNFGRDGSYYHIPKDHFEVIEKALKGEPHAGYSEKAMRGIVERAREIHRLSGQDDFGTVVRSGISKYADVQQGRVHSTLDHHENELSKQNKALKSEIRARHAPSLAGAAQAAGVGAAVGAGVRLAASVWKKHEQGKRVFAGDYTAQDWQDVGVDVVTGAAQGGVSAAAIYGLTNYARLVAPFAGAVVSSAAAVGELARRYYAGEISFDELCELGMVSCIEGAVVGLAAAAGQTLIPVPVLGATIGAIAGRLLASSCRNMLERDSRAVAARLQAQHDETLAKVDQVGRQFIESMTAWFDRLGDLTAAAFDVQANVDLRLMASVQLARFHGVDEKNILETVYDVDRFFLT